MSDDRDRRAANEEPPVVIRDKRKFDAQGNLRTPDVQAGSSADVGAGAASAPTMSQADVDAQVQLIDLQDQLDERTADLQRLTAEYANYRKRVDRDRIAVGELAIGRVLDAFLPVLDDIERADAHGDLTGAFKAVADKVVDGLGKLGLEAFGQAGDQFDPALHQAVMHDESEDVSTATASTVMRRGYRLGERLLRPAMVGVTAPVPTAPAPTAPAPAPTEAATAPTEAATAPEEPPSAEPRTPDTASD